MHCMPSVLSCPGTDRQGRARKHRESSTHSRTSPSHSAVGRRCPWVQSIRRPSACTQRDRQGRRRWRSFLRSKAEEPKPPPRNTSRGCSVSRQWRHSCAGTCPSGTQGTATSLCRKRSDLAHRIAAAPLPQRRRSHWGTKCNPLGLCNSRKHMSLGDKRQGAAHCFQLGRRSPRHTLDKTSRHHAAGIFPPDTKNTAACHYSARYFHGCTGSDALSRRRRRCPAGRAYTHPDPPDW